MSKQIRPRYSGPGATGICMCGCPWDYHHLCRVTLQEYVDATGEIYLPDACCKFGSNETGGMKFNEITGEYEDHCHRYEDSGLTGDYGHN